MSFFPVLDQFRALRESCVANQSCCNFLFLWNLRHLRTDLTINFACELQDEFCLCTIENWMVVGWGYFSHTSSHSKNVASARRVLHCAMYSECIISREVRCRVYTYENVQVYFVHLQKIGDFGLATRLTMPNEKHYTMCGTPNYISPWVNTLRISN